MTINWKKFFENYRILNALTDTDLLYQVGRTVDGKPISIDEFNKVLAYLERTIPISNNDYVVDLCCGNGLITFHFSKICKKVVGIDFSEPYIKNAKRLKSNLNIDYFCDDVMNVHRYLLDGSAPNIYFMYGSIGFFNPQDIDKLINEFKKASKSFTFFIGNVPDLERQWEFYNTLNRRIKRVLNMLNGKQDAIGRWWTKKELVDLARKHGLDIKFIIQDRSFYTSHYRFDLTLIHNT